MSDCCDCYDLLACFCFPAHWPFVVSTRAPVPVHYPYSVPFLCHSGCYHNLKMESGWLEFVASPRTSPYWYSLGVATGRHKAIYDLKSYITKIRVISASVCPVQLLRLLNALDPISCKGFLYIPRITSVTIARESKYINCTFSHVMLILDSTNFLLIFFKVFRRAFYKNTS